jgi:hypothetical protein
MPVSLEPPVFLTASLVNGLPTVVFPSQPYKRLIRSVWVNSVVTATVTLTRGGASNTAIIDSSTIANPNTFNNSFILPAGQSLYVTFSVAASPVSAAAAKLQSMREW